MKRIFLSLSVLSVAAGAHAQSTVNVDGTYETWRSYNSGGVALEAPSGWTGIDSAVAAFLPFTGAVGKKQVFKTTDKHGGSFAAQLMSRTQGAFGAVPGVISNAKLSVNIVAQTPDYSGGTPISQRVSKMTLWAKYIPKNTADSADLYITAVRGGSNGGSIATDTLVGEGELLLKSTAAYTQFDVPLTYISGMTPNKMVIVLASSADLGTAADSSTLFVDDVTVTLSPSGITIPVDQQKIVSCFPNPSNGLIHLKADASTPVLWEAYTADGKLVAAKRFAGAAEVDLTAAQSGQYIYLVKDESGRILQSGSFTLVR